MVTFFKPQVRPNSTARALMFSLLLLAVEPAAKAEDVVDQLLNRNGDWLTLVETLETLPFSALERHPRFDELLQLLNTRSQSGPPRVRSRYLVTRAFLGDSETDIVDEVLKLARDMYSDTAARYSPYSLHANHVIAPVIAAGKLPAWRNRRHRKTASLGQLDAIDRLFEKPMQNLAKDPVLPFSILFALAEISKPALNSKTLKRLSSLAIRVATAPGQNKSDLGRQARNMAKVFNDRAVSEATYEPEEISWEWGFINQAVSPGRRDWRMLLEVTTVLALDPIQGTRRYFVNPMGTATSALVWPSAMQAVLKWQLVDLNSGNEQFVHRCQELILPNDGPDFDFREWRQMHQLY